MKRTHTHTHTFQDFQKNSKQNHHFRNSASAGIPAIFFLRSFTSKGITRKLNPRIKQSGGGQLHQLLCNLYTPKTIFTLFFWPLLFAKLREMRVFYIGWKKNLGSFQEVQNCRMKDLKHFLLEISLETSTANSIEDLIFIRTCQKALTSLQPNTHILQMGITRSKVIFLSNSIHWFS